VNFDLLTVLGPTASGKTRLGVELARRFSGEVISADSRQVYRGMDLGTGKDLAEYGEIPHHLIDIVPSGSEFNVFQFQRHYLAACADIRTRGRVPVLVGGTGMYLDAALGGRLLQEVPADPALRDELDRLSMETLADRLRVLTPRLHNTTDLLERPRLVRAIEIAAFEAGHPAEPLPPLRSCIFGIRRDRETLRRRITLRLRERLDQGMIEEVARLHDAGVPWEKLEFYGLEYRFIARHLQGELSRNDMFQKLNSAIHDFAKRQETWFRRMERNGTVIHWLNGAGEPLGEALAIIHNASLKG
jgi:tRNA dimethylallyltransferase